MADSKSKTDHRDARRSESESEEQIREAEGGDTQIDDEWGFFDKKPGLASETKAGLGIIVLLICTFCFLVYRKYDAREQLANGIDGDDAGMMTGKKVADIQPGNGASSLFIDNSFTADNGPPPQSEPQPPDDEPYSDRDSQAQPVRQSEIARAGDAHVSPNEPDSIDESEDTMAGDAAGMTNDIAEFDDSSNGFGDGFSDPAADGFDDSFDAGPPAQAADVAVADMENEFFGSDSTGSFDGGADDEDPLFDDEFSDPAPVAAGAAPKPVTDDFFDSNDTAAAVVEGASNKSDEADIFDEPTDNLVDTAGRTDDPTDNSVDTVGRTGDQFDNPPAGLLFDDDFAPSKPGPIAVSPDPIPSRNEIIAADRGAPASVDSRQSNPMDEINTVRAEPVGRFSDSLFGDETGTADSDRLPIAKRVEELPADNHSDDALLFEDSVVIDSPAARPGRISIREAVPGSIPIDSVPAVDHEPNFSDSPRGRVLFDDESANNVPETPSNPARRVSGFDDAVFEPGTRQNIPAETAVLRREDISDVYVVQPGDNYWRISRNQYGTSRFYMALARLNRQRVEDPRRLKPGMKLHTPSTQSLIQRFPELFPDGVQTVSATRSVGPRGFFIAKDGRSMYRTSRHDTLSGIAQNHLGRASRWKQVYQLNRNTLENPNEVKDGLVLVLPDDASQVRMVR